MPSVPFSFCVAYTFKTANMSVCVLTSSFTCSAVDNAATSFLKDLAIASISVKSFEDSVRVVCENVTHSRLKICLSGKLAINLHQKQKNGRALGINTERVHIFFLIHITHE